MKTITIGILATIIAVIAQMLLIGINGLTLVSIPLTIFLGIEVIERLTEGETTNN